MQILINEKKEIIGYCTVGEIIGGTETDKSFPSNYSRYKFIYNEEDDTISENPNYELSEPYVRSQIEHYKNLLESTDYKAIKYAEGLLTEEEYQDIKTTRQSYRAEINRLEENLENQGI